MWAFRWKIPTQRIHVGLWKRPQRPVWRRLSLPQFPSQLFTSPHNKVLFSIMGTILIERRYDLLKVNDILFLKGWSSGKREKVLKQNLSLNSLHLLGPSALLWCTIWLGDQRYNTISCVTSPEWEGISLSSVYNETPHILKNNNLF